MNIDSIYFKGYSCFKKDWAGFDTIKPINVIIGRNNSGKSHLLDLVEALCDPELSHHEWQNQCHGVLDEESLKKIFPARPRDTSQNSNADLVLSDVQPLVGEKLIWEVAPSQFESLPHGYELQVSSLRFPAFSSEQSSNIPLAVEEVLKSETHQFSYSPKQSGNISSGVSHMLQDATHQFRKDSFCRLLADRDIKTELKNTNMNLGRDGQGATNIIRGFITSDKLPRELIEDDLLDELKLIFGNDGQFLDIGVQELDKEDNTKDYWEVYIREEKKGWIPLSKSGSGLKTVILVLLNLLVIPKIEDKERSQFKFAFEELENNLHPALLRRLFKYLEDYAVKEKAKIFLTTHSSVALDLFGASDHAQIIHMSHDGESARTTTIPTHSGYLKIISELGVRPSDLLQVNGLIWVEGPSDRIYLNRWIELYTDGRLREGRDYQCVFYGGSILSQVQFKPPEDEVTKLANLFQINHNLVVVCDGDRIANGSDLKPRVERIREEVEKIDDAYIWITDAKEIENYIPGSVLAEATGLSPLPDPKKYESWSSYTEKNMDGKRIDKVDLAISSIPSMTIKLMQGRFDWKEQMKQIVERIDSWNGDSPST